MKTFREVIQAAKLTESKDELDKYLQQSNAKNVNTKSELGDLQIVGASAVAHLLGDDALANRIREFSTQVAKLQSMQASIADSIVRSAAKAKK